MIRFWSCPVHAGDADRSTVSFAGKMISPVESHVLTEMDAMDSIVLSTCDACCTIQLLCHMLSSPHFSLQLPAYEPSSLLDQGCMSDQASGGLLFLRREYLQVVAHQVHCLWVDYWLTSSSMAIQVHRLKSNLDGSGWSHPAGGKIPSGNSPLLIIIGWYCWQWTSSPFSANNYYVLIKHITGFRRVSTIFEKWSVHTSSDASRRSFFRG